MDNCTLACEMSDFALIRKISERILLIREEKVILDSDLAEFYGVVTKRLNEQVKRNRGRFPGDFAFQLTVPEKTLECGRPTDGP